MQKKYDVYVHNVDYENKPKIGSSPIIKPIKDLTQNILFWQNKDTLKGLLYQEVFEEKKEVIIATLNLLNNNDLIELIIECKHENNLLLCDICKEILERKMLSYSLEDVELLFIQQNANYLREVGYFSLVRDMIIKILNGLSNEELLAKAEYYKEAKTAYSRECLNLNRGLNMAQYNKIQKKSTDAKEKILYKSDIEWMKSEETLALFNMYHVLHERVVNIIRNAENRTI